MFYTNIGRTLDLDVIGQNIHGFEEGQTINLLGKKTSGVCNMYDIWEINKTGDTWLGVQIWMIHIGYETGMEFLDRLLEKGYPKEMFDYFQQINVLHGLININGIMYTPRHAIINSEIFKDFIKKSNCCTECGIVFNEEELEFQLCPNCRKEIFEKSRKYEMESKGNVSLFLKNERTK